MITRGAGICLDVEVAVLDTFNECRPFAGGEPEDGTLRFLDLSIGRIGMLNANYCLGVVSCLQDARNDLRLEGLNLAGLRFEASSEGPAVARRTTALSVRKIQRWIDPSLPAWPTGTESIS